LSSAAAFNNFAVVLSLLLSLPVSELRKCIARLHAAARDCQKPSG
jgi:hypothetical protein